MKLMVIIVMFSMILTLTTTLALIKTENQMPSKHDSLLLVFWIVNNVNIHLHCNIFEKYVTPELIFIYVLLRITEKVAVMFKKPNTACYLGAQTILVAILEGSWQH